VPKPARVLRESHVRAGLVLLALVVRIPLVRHFDFVSFDGTFYLSQARALLHGQLAGGSFPIGYPLAVAPFLAVMRDAVWAGMLVSALAAVGSTLVLYELLKRWVTRPHAILGAAVFAVTPLIIQTSLLTFSESLYGFWVLLGLLLFARGHHKRAGLALGLAAITRPEALAIAGVLGLLALRRSRRAWALPLVFAAVYAVGVAAISVQHGRLVLLSRAGAYSSIATPWVLRETSIDYQGKDMVEERVREKAAEVDRLQGYARRLPASLGSLARQTLFVLPLLAVLAVTKRRLFVLAAFVPLLVIPLFTEERGHVRWLAPYVGPLIVLGMLGLEQIKGERARALVRALVLLAALLSPLLNRATLTGGIEREFIGAKESGKRMGRLLQPGDRIADRKPYAAFYAGAPYLEIPVAPYHEALDHLAGAPIRFLSLHQQSIGRLRPALRPLLFDPVATRGELRYRQLFLLESGEIVYERTLDADPLVTRSLAVADARDFAPAWSPDGKQIAFRRVLPDGTGRICLADPDGGNVQTLHETTSNSDALAWSPDGRRLLFSMPDGEQQDLFVLDVATRQMTRLTQDPANDFSPTWCPSTGEIAFASQRGGRVRVWLRDTRGNESLLSSADQDAGLPGFSPDGRVVAWIDGVGRLVLRNRASTTIRTVAEPVGILSQPAWSPDGRVVAVGGFDWGSADVYLIRVEDGRALRVTSALTGEGMPSWSPDGTRLAITRGERSQVSLAILDNLAPYRARLDEDYEFRVFQRPAEMRFTPPRPER